MQIEFNWYLKNRDLIEHEIRKIIISKHVKKKYPTIYEPVFYLLNTQGKMIRGMLTLLTCKLVGGEITNILPAAAGLELAHLASLIHDDIIDSSTVRRGISSVHNEFGVNTALLSGDMYFFYACYGLTLVKKVSLERVLESVRIISHSALDIVYGQHLEHTLLGDPNVTYDDYIKIIKLKTGKLVESCCRIGGVLGGVNSTQCKILSDFGINLGIAFQIRDDILSFIGNKYSIDKPPEIDLKNNIVTLPILAAQRDIKKKNQIIKLFSKKRHSKNEIHKLKKLVSNDDLEYSSSILQKFYRKSINQLKRFPRSQTRDMLMEVSKFSIERNY